MVLKSRKHVFWEALFVTILVFAVGLFLGMMIETNNSNKISQMYLKSEIGLVDGMAITILSEDFNYDCEVIKKNNIKFADRIYEEAIVLEDYENAGILTDNLKFLHKKYDLLRTLLWMSNQDSLQRCENYDLVVYLYEYDTEDNEKKATQNVWSKILYDLKVENPDILLLPIASDQNLTSLDFLAEQYVVEDYPALIVNNEYVLYDLESASWIKENFLR